jgi:hypothetical protein
MVPYPFVRVDFLSEAPHVDASPSLSLNRCIWMDACGCIPLTFPFHSPRASLPSLSHLPCVLLSYVVPQHVVFLFVILRLILPICHTVACLLHTTDGRPA